VVRRESFVGPGKGVVARIETGWILEAVSYLKRVNGEGGAYGYFS